MVIASQSTPERVPPTGSRRTEQALKPIQPLLDHATTVIRAPIQVWSRDDGTMAEDTDGIYLGDVRHVGFMSCGCAQGDVRWVSTASRYADEVVFGAVLLGIGDDLSGPRLRWLKERRAEGGGVVEEWTLVSDRSQPTSLELHLEMEPDFSSLQEIRSGAPTSHVGSLACTESRACAEGQRSAVGFVADFPGADVSASEGRIRATWNVTIPAHSEFRLTWRIRMRDSALVVGRPDRSWPRLAEVVALDQDPSGKSLMVDPSLIRWCSRAWSELDALRLTARSGNEQFFAAGAPWYFTLFGRDSLWAARFVLPYAPQVALSTLRALAQYQGTAVAAGSAEEPGKIPHEIRSEAMDLQRDGASLPPVYFGSADATLLWICLLCDTWQAGASWNVIESLIPALRGCLHWMLTYADGNGDGFIDYRDDGSGLENQGWKDSGEAIRWRDGRLAEGSIALCELQGYANEAAEGAADLLQVAMDAGVQASGGLGAEITPEQLRAWAQDLRRRFRESYWVTTEEGRYPAVALDGHGRAVDALTSNIGHLLGTGLLSTEEEGVVTGLLLGADMSSGYGIRTLSARSVGYWPLSYHCGSVWTHDSAVAARGMYLAGRGEEACRVVDECVRAAEGFQYRIPELFSGDSVFETPVPTPYPTSCRPQAWSSAAALQCLTIVRSCN